MTEGNDDLTQLCTVGFRQNKKEVREQSLHGGCNLFVTSLSGGCNTIVTPLFGSV